jgi:hypothetical protein
MFLRKLLCISLLTAPLFAQNSSEAIRRGADLIRTDDLKGDIYFLASKDMAGRDAGSLQDHIATDYIASEFLRLGLKPMGDDGTFFQKMEILTGRPEAQQTTLTTTVDGEKHRYTLGQEFTLVRQSIHNTSACGEVVFAGYGISAPEFDYDDFSGIDVKGKVALVFLREPQANDTQSKFMGTWDSYHAFNWHKIEELRKRGAAAILIVQDGIPRDVKPIPPTSPRPSGQPSYALAGQMWDIPVFLIKREVADQLLAPSGKNANELQASIDHSLHPQSFEIEQSSACLAKSYSDISSREGRNVVALLEGSDPKLKAQTILLTAHHDHMGEANGHIYYGADDNASGVAGLLSVARAMTQAKLHPKRSVLFLAYTAEERIFLGSYFYATHPVVPLNQTIATLNLDMIGRNEDDANWPTPADRNVNMVNVLGTRYNPALRRVIDQQNQREGLKLDYKMDKVDPDSLWSRSDHFWFATLHIPQVEFQTGLHPDYHTENDTWDRINYPKLTKIARLVYLSVAGLADTSREIPFVSTGESSASKAATKPH